MPGISRVGVDVAGGAILGGGATGWTLDGATISLVGDAVSPHGLPPHSGPSMVSGSNTWRINGVPIVRAGSSASCGHTASGHGSWNVP